MKRYVLTPSAKRDVDDIWDYIANDNIEAADRVLDALESAMVKLANNPGVGHWRELTDKSTDFFWLFVSDRLLAQAKPLQIVRVLHARVMCKVSWASPRDERIAQRKKLRDTIPKPLA